MNVLKKPFFSVILPTSGRLHLLRQSLTSLQLQSESNWECLLINDKAPEHEAIVAMLEQMNDDRIVLLANPGKCGQNNCRLIGLNRSRGEYIAFLDDDDLWFPEKLEKHGELHRRQRSPGAVFSASLLFWEKTTLPPVILAAGLPPSDPVEALRQGSWFPARTSAITVARSCFENKSLIDPTVSSFTDQDLWFCLAGTFPISHSPEILNAIREHLNPRMSSNLDEREKGLRDLCLRWKLPPAFMGARHNRLKPALAQNALHASISGNRSRIFPLFFRYLRQPLCFSDLKAVLKLLFLFLAPFSLFRKMAFRKHASSAAWQRWNDLVSKLGFDAS